MRERLTTLVIVGTRKDEHSLRSQVGIDSKYIVCCIRLQDVCIGVYRWV